MRKIVLFVIDSLSNTVIDVLLRDNKLPTLKKLINRGVKRMLFDIHKDNPWVAFSGLGVRSTASLWTTLATGVMPEKHKIISHTKQDARGIERTVSRRNRKKPAMWEIIAQHNRKVGTIGWIANWPPIAVPDYTVVRIADVLESQKLPLRINVDSYNNFSFDKEIFLSNPAYPRRLWKELKKISFDRKLDGFINKVINTESYISYMLQRDAIHDSLYLEWTKFLLKRFPQPDFLAISLYHLHNLSHLFWDCLKMERRHFQGIIHRNRQKRFGYVIEDYYQYLDKRINEILELIESNSIIIVVSPYGMHRARITKKYLLMNRIYEKLGLLKYNRQGIDWNKTKVYDNQNPWGIFVKRKGFIRGNYPERIFSRLGKSLKKIKTERNENLFLEITYNKKDNSFEVMPNYKTIHYSTKIFLNNEYYPVKNLVRFLPHYSLHSPSDGIMIISGKDIQRVKTIKSQITLLDIAPTVFNFLGIKYKDMPGKPVLEF